MRWTQTYWCKPFMAGIAACLVWGSPYRAAAQGMVRDPSKYLTVLPPVPKTTPDWAKDAQWYQLAVTRFANGDPSNDPSSPEPGSTHTGGDLKGLVERFDYLKALGVNTLYLTDVFHRVNSDGKHDTDFRHIRDSIAVADSLKKIPEESVNPRTWKWSESDLAFMAFTAKAHQAGFRVVVRADLYRSKHKHRQSSLPNHLRSAMARWFGSKRDRDSSAGIDGIVTHQPRLLSRDFWRLFRRTTKAAHPEILLVGVPSSDPGLWWDGTTFDAIYDDAIAQALLKLSAPNRRDYTVRTFLSDLQAITSRQTLDQQLVTPLGLVGPNGSRFLTALEALPPDAKDGDKPSGINQREEYARRAWRIAAVIQYTVGGAPLTLSGDELGFLPNGKMASEVLWGESQPAPKALASDQNYFASLLQWLAFRRDHHEPLRRGTLRGVFSDNRRNIFAFARELPGERVIVVVNFNGQRQRVTIPAGKPGTKVGVLTPFLHPIESPKGRQPPIRSKPGNVIPALRATGTRQFLDAGGHARFFMEPWSVALVMVREEKLSD